MKSKLICFILVIVIALSGAIQSVPAFAADTETISFPVRYGQTDARKMGDKLNALRASNGKGQLVYDYTLEKVAMQRAAEVVVRFDAEGENHYRPDGNAYKQTLADFGFDISGRGPLYGENILSGTDDTMDLDSAFDQFCTDDKNKRIMLGDFAAFGVAHIKMEDKTDIWVQVFSDEGSGGSFTSPLDGTAVASVRINPYIVEDVKVEYSSGPQTVAAGSTVSVPSYIPKITVSGSELKDPLTLSPLVFNSNDGYVMAANGTMTGLQEGTGTISTTFLGRSFSYSVTVTAGSGYVGPVPTQTVITPTPTPAVTAAPSPTETVVGWRPTPIEQEVTSTPSPTQAVTPTPSPTQSVTSAPEPTKEASTGLKKGDTFTEGKLQYKVTGAKTVAVIAPASKNAKTISIPATVKKSGVSFKVTEIAESAFENNTKLKTVKLGKNIKSIGAKAFKGCKALKKINIPKKTTSIGKEAFSNINSKAVIKVPSSAYKKIKKLLDESGITCTVKKS